MYDYLIYDQLKKYSKVKKDFHVPGHKGRGDFSKMFPVADIDVTELSYSDNLSCPRNIISEAQMDIAQILGARKSYIVTDGSTAGVLSMMYVASRLGNKIIVPRNCHQSVWNACKIFGLEPVIVQGESRHGVLLPPEPTLVQQLIANDVNISGMILTYPDYYGNLGPLSVYSAILRRYQRLLIVDGAHGAHFAFEPERRQYAGVYADMWVDGVHKSLPCLTQGAVVSASNPAIIPLLEEALSIFRTTSPSYPIMASVEFGIKYLKNNDWLLERAKDAVSNFKANAKDIYFYPSADWTKLIVDCKKSDISADIASKMLENKGIYSEFSDGRYLLFYLSPLITAKDLKGLGTALRAVLSNKRLKGSYKPRLPFPENARTYSFQYALGMPCEAVPLEEAEGRMCARSVGVAPPCIPVVVAGEIISDAVIKRLWGEMHTFGMVGDKIWVVKK